MSRPAEPARRQPARLSRVPAAVAAGAATLVRALRAAGAAFRSLPAVHRLAGGVDRGALRGVARPERAPGGPRTQVRRLAADRRRPDGRDGAAAPSQQRTVGLDTYSPRHEAIAPARLQPERSPGARAGPTMADSRTCDVACPHARDADANGVDTGDASGECGGGVWSAKCEMWNAKFRISTFEFRIDPCGRRFHHRCHVSRSSESVRAGRRDTSHGRHIRPRGNSRLHLRGETWQCE